MKSARIIVSSNPANLASVVSQLKKHGMKVNSVLDATGTVLGEIDADKLSALQGIDGVSVEREDAVRIPPPDAPVQ
jgi:hypothetical protein